MYKAIIVTDNYRHQPCSKQNWEPGTMNDFVMALNGWKSTESSLQKVRWLIELFFGGLPYEHHYDKSWKDYDKFWKWYRSKKESKFIYHDRLCGFDRTDRLGVYGIAQGYVNPDKKMEKLKSNGVVRIEFGEAYDIRQRGCTLFNGCFMEIIKV